MKSNIFSSLLLLLSFSIAAHADSTTWNDGDSTGAGFGLYSDSANWSNGVPTTTSDVVIGTMLGIDNTILLDTGGSTIGSLTFANSLNTGVMIVPGSGDQLTINGNITNSSLFQDTFQDVVNAGANATYTGGAAGLQIENTLNVSHFNIATSGSVVVASGNTLVFDVNSLSSYGKIGSIGVNGDDIAIEGSYKGNAGDVFNLTTGNFSGATLDPLPVLSPGLFWNTSSFLADGVLTVEAVPEPSTYALLLVGGLVLLGLRKRQTLLARLSVIRK
jgi:hypothetical protein